MEKDKTRFASEVPTRELCKRILRLLDTKEVRELDLLVKELRRRKHNLKKRIITEMTDIENMVND